MGKLHELLAVEGDLNGQANKILEETKHIFSKGDDFVVGFKKTYRATVEGEEELPPESKELRTTVPDRVRYTVESLGKLIDACCAKEVTNTTAFADVVVEGKVVKAHLPAQALLNLEAKLKLFRDTLALVPTLDAATRWAPETTMSNTFRSPTEVKSRTRKIEDYKVVVQPTKEHPAQVMKTVEDRKVGEWSTTVFCGAVSAVTKSRWLGNLDRLLMAVKQARQRANMADIVRTEVAADFFACIFGDDLK